MSFDRAPELTLYLAGPLRLVRRDGTEATPRVAKAQGILALLGAAPAMRRPRPWLQDKLWSDQPPENGSDSLRQTIHRLRRAVDMKCDWLVTLPGWLGLDPAHVSVVLDPAVEDWDAAGEPPEFCEGLDIADPEFEDWIRDQRFAFEERVTESGVPPVVSKPLRPAPVVEVPKPSTATLLIASPLVDSDVLQSLAELLSSEIASCVARFGGADVRHDGDGAAPPADALRLRVKACRMGARALIQAELSDAESGRVLWTNKRALAADLAGGGAVSAMELFVAEVTAATTFELGRDGPGGNGSQVRAAYRALRDVLSFDSAKLERCDQVFASLSGQPGAIVHQAWRAQIRVFSIIERLSVDIERAKLEAKEFTALALEKDPYNPIVNAIAAEVALYVENLPLKAAQLAKVAAEQGSSIAIVHSSLSQALARLGHSSQAHASALHALRLSATLPDRAMWFVRCCVTAMRCGRYDEARGYALTANELAPDFKPPLRFLAALHFYLGDSAASMQAFQRLKGLEPDFCLKLMADKQYPVMSLRDTPLMQVTESALI